MENQFRVHLLVLIGILLSISLTACGGESNPQSSLPPQIAPELLIDSHVIPHVNAITSDQNYLYLATQFELIRYDKVTGIREVLAGNLVDPFANFELDVVYRKVCRSPNCTGIDHSMDTYVWCGFNLRLTNA